MKVAKFLMVKISMELLVLLVASLYLIIFMNEFYDIKLHLTVDNYFKNIDKRITKTIFLIIFIAFSVRTFKRYQYLKVPISQDKIIYTDEEILKIKQKIIAFELELDVISVKLNIYKFLSPIPIIFLFMGYYIENNSSISIDSFSISSIILVLTFILIMFSTIKKYETTTDKLKEYKQKDLVASYSKKVNYHL